MDLDGQLVLELRRLAADGVLPSKLIPVIANRLGIDQSACRLQAVAYFREAFQLSMGDAMRIGAAEVFPDGGSDDSSLDQELARTIQSTSRWWETQS